MKNNKLKLKKIFLHNIIPAICFIVGIVLFIEGLNAGTPRELIFSDEVTKYLNGDAYNYMIEASIRGGQIAGAMITKCAYTLIGLLISCMSALKFKIDFSNNEN